ncbi:MAG: glycosyltransferase [Nitrospirae bacterium]|nr:glycosyltransferase [Nitrospirota bacterium]
MHQNNYTNIIENQSIICFAPDPWDTMWRNRHQIMSRLSLKNKVLYIEPNMYDVRQGIMQGIGLFEKSWTGRSLQNGRLKHITNGLWVYQHPYWGVNSRWPVLKQLGRRLRVSAIHHVIRKLQMNAPILWVVDPRFGNMINYFKKALVCYHVVDNYAAAPYFSEKTREDLKQAEKFILPIADLVIVTSPFLLEQKREYNNNVYLVKNAVDYEQFAFLQDVNNIPEDMENIHRPVIGYIGAVNKKLDYKLLDTVARARPQWSFVFVGEIYPGAPGSQIHDFLHNHPPNVFLLGRRDVKEVPHYIHACNICILPYLRDDYTKAIDSLKLYEYFACEKPVVATDIPVIREHGPAVYIAKNANDFVHKLEEALVSSTPERSALQRSIAMQNTWDQRVEQLSFIIKAALLKKSGQRCS